MDRCFIIAIMKDNHKWHRWLWTKIWLLEKVISRYQLHGHIIILMAYMFTNLIMMDADIFAMFWQSDSLEFFMFFLSYMCRALKKVQKWIFICFIWTRYQKENYVKFLFIKQSCHQKIYNNKIHVKIIKQYVCAKSLIDISQNVTTPFMTTCNL